MKKSNNNSNLTTNRFYRFYAVAKLVGKECYKLYDTIQDVPIIFNFASVQKMVETSEYQKRMTYLQETGDAELDLACWKLPIFTYTSSDLWDLKIEAITEFGFEEVKLEDFKSYCLVEFKG